MKFLKKKIVYVPLSIITYIIIWGLWPKATGALTIAGCLGGGIYLFSKNEVFKNKGKMFKSLTTIVLLMMFLLFGIGGVTFDPVKANEARLIAENQKIEEQNMKEAQKKIKEQEQEKILKEEADRKIEEEKQNQEQEEKEKKEQEEKDRLDVAQKEKKEQEEKDRLELEERARVEAENQKNVCEKNENNARQECNEGSIHKTETKHFVNTNIQDNSNSVNKGQERKVWISATGDCYHAINNCGKMNPKRASQVTLSEAKKSYSSCAKCHP